MDQRLLAPLNAFEASLNALVQSLTTTNAFAAVPKATKDLLAADADTTEALVILKNHQDNYRQILRLRAEKEALWNKIKETVFECQKLKQNLGNIHPSILEDTEDEEETAKNHRPIDYETLLALASRIGKSNAIAAQEAERESERLYLEAKKNREEDRANAQPTLNGIHAQVTVAAAEARPTTSHTDLETQEAQAVAENMRMAREAERWRRTLPHPNPELLRKGELGRLQIMREQYGELAVDAEVEKLVRQSEMGEVEPVIDPAPPAEDVPQRPVNRLTQQARPEQPPPKPRPKINLDFPGDDDDD